MYNPNRDFAMAIGQGLTAGLDAYDQTQDKQRQIQEQQRQVHRQELADQMAQAQAEREAQRFSQAQAESRYKVLANTMQNQMVNGDYAGAAKTRQQLIPALNEATGLSLPNAAINGALKTVTTNTLAARPMPGMQGPMPFATKKVQAFDNAQTQAALWATPGLEKPKPKLEDRDPFKEQGYWTTGADGNPQWVPVSAAKAKPTSTPTTLSYNGDGTATVVPKTPGAKVKVKPPAPPRARASSGGSPKPVNYQTKVVWENGKAIIYTFNPRTKQFETTGKEAPPRSTGSGDAPPWAK